MVGLFTAWSLQETAVEIRGQRRVFDHRTVDHSWLADVRASLADDFATQTARLRELTELNADTGDPGDPGPQPG